MRKFHGHIGFAEQVETSPGVFRDRIVTRSYFGDFGRKGSNASDGETLNGDISLNMMLSIVADEYLYVSYPRIKYVEWMGTKWTVSAVEVARPRLTLYFGRRYNGA